MAIFDSIISEAAERFGLGDKAGPLVGALLSMITSNEGGGLAGFISKFTGAGMGDLVNSWISTGDSQPISENQLSSVLGGDVISGIADKVGIPGSLASSALAFILPGVIDKLTPDGIVPTSLPDTIINYIGGLTGLLGKGVSGVADAAGSVVSGAADLAGKGLDAAGDLASGAAGLAGKGIDAAGDLASGAVGAVGAGLAGAAGVGVAGARAAANMAEDTAKSGMSWLLKLLPLLLLALIAFLAYNYCNSSTPTTPVVTTSPTVAVPKIDSSIQVTNVDGRYKVNATVSTEAEKAELIKHLDAAYGAGKYDANIKVDSNAKPAGWLAKLGDALKELKAGAELSIVGSAITISGLAKDAAAALQAKLGSIFGTGFNINTRILDAAAAVKDAAAATAGALAGIHTGSTDELVKALNLQIINFASGSNAIPKENEEMLKKSAAAIKAAAAGTKLEVGGYTDNKGAAAGNLTLSQKRAAAVLTYLVKNGVKADALMAKGHGADNPRASNDTEEGRFQNRRIEFSVAK